MLHCPRPRNASHSRASECFTVGAHAGQEAKVGGTGVIDGPQITTNTGIKDKHFIGAAFVAFIAVKLK